MKIGLDLDGVIYQFSKTAQYMLAKRAGHAKREDFIWDNSVWNCGIPKEDWDWVLSPPQADAVFRYGHLFSGAIEFVHDLSKLGSVAIITKRPVSGIQATLDFLSYMKFPIKELHIIGNQENKSDIKADVYIDDSPDNAVDYAANTKSLVILIDRPWNRNFGFLCNRIKRAYTFEGAVQYVKKLKEEPWNV